MKNRRIYLYMFIIGFSVILSNTILYFTPVTPQTRIIQRLSETEAMVVFVIAGILTIVGIIGIIRNLKR